MIDVLFFSSFTNNNKLNDFTYLLEKDKIFPLRELV